MFQVTNDCNGHPENLSTFHGFLVHCLANSLVVSEAPLVERMYTGLMELESHEKLAVSAPGVAGRSDGTCHLFAIKETVILIHTCVAPLHDHRHYCLDCQLFTQFTLIEHLLS